MAISATGGATGHSWLCQYHEQELPWDIGRVSVSPILPIQILAPLSWPPRPDKEHPLEQDVKSQPWATPSFPTSASSSENGAGWKGLMGRV